MKNHVIRLMVSVGFLACWMQTLAAAEMTLTAAPGHARYMKRTQPWTSYEPVEIQFTAKGKTDNAPGQVDLYTRIQLLQGNTVLKDDTATQSFRTASTNYEYWFRYSYGTPKLTVGKYKIRVSIMDLKTKEEAQVEMPFEVVAGNDFRLVGISFMNSSGQAELKSNIFGKSQDIIAAGFFLPGTEAAVEIYLQGKPETPLFTITNDKFNPAGGGFYVPFQCSDPGKHVLLIKATNLKTKEKVEYELPFIIVDENGKF